MRAPHASHEEAARRFLSQYHRLLYIVSLFAVRLRLDLSAPALRLVELWQTRHDPLSLLYIRVPTRFLCMCYIVSSSLPCRLLPSLPGPCLKRALSKSCIRVSAGGNGALCVEWAVGLRRLGTMLALQSVEGSRLETTEMHIVGVWSASGTRGCQTLVYVREMAITRR